MDIEFLVIESSKYSEGILELKSCEDLKLAQRIGLSEISNCKLNHQTETDCFIQKNIDIFSGNSKINYKVHFDINSNCEVTIKPPKT